MERKFCVSLCLGVQRQDTKFSWAELGNKMMKFSRQYTAQLARKYINCFINSVLQKGTITLHHSMFSALVTCRQT